MLPWFEETPELLEQERRSLSNLSIDFSINTPAMEKGVLELSLIITTNNFHFNISRDLKIRIIYPDTFPHFAPSVYAEDLDLVRHYNPFGKNLCLLDRPTENWNASWTIGKYLKSQLNTVLEKGRETDQEKLQNDPNEHPEPFAAYYADFSNLILFDANPFQDFPHSKTEIQFMAKGLLGIPDNQQLYPDRMAILEFRTLKNKLQHKLHDIYFRYFPNSIDVFLFSLPEKPPYGNAVQDLEWLRDELPEKLKWMLSNSKKKFTFKKDQTTLNQAFGFCFPQEIRAGVLGRGWVFLLKGSYPQFANKKRRLPPKWDFKYFPVGKIDSSSMTERIPEVSHLKEKVIAVFGLGALGAPSVIELAKNGIGALKLWDFDLIDPVTTVRWPIGLSVAGYLKTQTLSDFIMLNYPYTKVDFINYRIGTPRQISQNPKDAQITNEKQLLENFLKNVDLIYDATVENMISNLLSEEAKKRNIPYVRVESTPGAVGGIVTRIRHQVTEGCWICSRYSLTNGDIPLPPKIATGLFRPMGCSDETFTGTSFDLMNICVAGVRLAISSLKCRESDHLDDIGVLSLVDENQQQIFPKWRSYKLTKNKDCPYCSPP